MVIQCVIPANPITLSTYSLTVYQGYNVPTFSITVLDNIIFVAGFHNHLQVFDFSDPFNLKQIGSYNTLSYTVAVKIQNDNAYVIDTNKVYILALNQGEMIGNPPTSSLVGNIFPITVEARTFNSVVSSDDFQLTIDQLPRPVISALLDHSLFPDGSLTLPLNTKLLFVNPHNNFLTLSLSLHDGNPVPNWLNLDLTITLAGTYSIDPMSTMTSLALLNNKAYIGIIGATNDLLVIDVTNPSNPVLLGKYSVIRNANGPYEAFYEIVLQNNLAFVANGNSGFNILDISNPANIYQLSGLNGNPVGGSWGGNWAVAISNNYAFLGEFSQPNLLEIVDISNPTSPVLLGSYFSGVGFTAAIRDNLLFLAGVGVTLVNVTHVNSPQLISYFIYEPSNVAGNLRGISVQDNLVFVHMTNWAGSD